MCLQKFLIILISVLLAGSGEAIPTVAWRFSAYPFRTVFRVPDAARTNIMLKVNRVGNMPVTRNGFLACSPDGTPLPLRVLHMEGDEVVLALEAPRSGAPNYAVYYGASPANELVVPLEAAVDPEPLAFGFMSLPGKGIPSSWERLRHMLKSPPGQIRTPYRMSGFDGIGKEMDRIESEKAEKETKGKKEGSRFKSGMKLALIRSFLLCHREGTYQFAVNCKDAGFVVVDGELAATWPGEHLPGTWQLGAPVALKAGVHRLEVFNAFDGAQPNLRVGWLPPGRKEFVPLAVPDLIASCEAMEARAERMDRTLQPGFLATLVQAYSFRGDADVFVTVKFNNTTENWITPEMVSRWQFGDGAQSDEQNPSHIYKTADVFKASLEVRDALGFVASCSESVDCRQIQPEEYAVSFDMVGLPALCFGRDQVAPSLRIQGVVPNDVVLDVSWEYHLRSGASQQNHQEITPKSQAQFIQLAPVAASEVESLNWSISHRKSRLGGELIKFVRPPFDTLPSRLEGDRLYAAGGTRLVLVPGSGVSELRRTVPVPGKSFGRLVCVDDSLAVIGLIKPGYEPFDRILARLLAGRVDEVRYASLPEWTQFSESYGSLRKFVDVPAALERERADVAILTIGLKDILEVKDVDEFERQVAALSDMVATLLNIKLVWVTPPPYPSAPERSRVFAAAIRRVADARGIPVADLFTAFSCVSDSRHVFFQENSLMLSEQGHRLAGQQIARALVGE